MSNKNINESLRDAWQKSIQNGDTIRSIRQKEKDQIDSIVEDKRNNVLSHLTENDKGFYRPETSPYHKFRDGEYLRRKRLMEQEAAAQEVDAGAADEEERKKKEAADKAAADKAAEEKKEPKTRESGDVSGSDGPPPDQYSETPSGTEATHRGAEMARRARELRDAKQKADAAVVARNKAKREAEAAAESEAGESPDLLKKPEDTAAEPRATDPEAIEYPEAEPGATEPGATEPGATEPGATEPGATDTAATDTAAAEPSGRGGGVLGGIGAGIRDAVGRARQTAAAEKEKQRQRDAGVPDELVGTPSARGAEGDYVPVKLGDEELAAGEQERRRSQSQETDDLAGGGGGGFRRFGRTRSFREDDLSPESIERKLGGRKNPDTGRPAKPGDRWESEDGSTVTIINRDGSSTLISKTMQAEIDKAAKELEDRVASGELEPGSDEYRAARRKAEHAGKKAGKEASRAEDIERNRKRYGLPPDATAEDVINHARGLRAKNDVESIGDSIARMEIELKYARTSGEKKSAELRLANLNRELKRAQANVEKYGSAAAGTGKAAATDADATDTAATDADATDTAAAGGAGGEDGPATEVTGDPVSTDTLQHGGVVEPTGEPEYSVDQAGKPTGETVIDDGNVRDVIVGPQTQMGDAPGKPGSGTKISGAMSTEIDLDKFGMPDNPDLQLKGTVQSRIRKDGAGYKEMRVDPKDPSGVEYIRNYQDGRKEIRYKTGKVTTLDAQGNAVQAGEAGAAPELSGLQSRKIDAEIAGNKDLQRMKRDLSFSAEVGGAGPRSSMGDFSGQAMERQRKLRSEIEIASEELARRMGVSADAVRAKFEAELGIPAKTDAEKQAAATQNKKTDVLNPDGPPINTATPPPKVGAPTQPTSPPPPKSAAEEEEEELAGPTQPVMQASSYNPINKYGINLFEAKGPLQR